MQIRSFVTIVFSIMVSLMIGTRSAVAWQPGKGAAETPQSKIPRGSGKFDGPPVKPVDASRLADVQKSAARIDALIDANYVKHGVTPKSKTNDAVYCRRTYLHLAGRIPTFEEALSFINSADESKRSKLVDRLLNSHGHVSHMFNYWADILRLQDNPINNNQIAQPYHEWIKKSLSENTPYDQWVTQMMTAQGRIWDNPAVGYSMRDSGMELDHVDNTAQVFLGTQIGCAQCHDHPFDK